MPSRLSSLLVRDGLVGVKRMEKAFQRQVIYGGSLDTILLEMNLVPEERLVQYLALASGLPPAARDDGKTTEPDALALIAREIAEQFRAVPLSLDGEAVRILVCAPLEISELEDLADLLDRPLQPLIAPEYRWHLAYAAAYGVEPTARFTMLARQIDAEATPVPVGRPRSVIVDDAIPSRRAADATAPLVPAPPVLPAGRGATPAAGERAPLAPVAPTDATLKLSAPPVDAADPRARTGTLVGVAPNRLATEAGAPAPLTVTPAAAQPPPRASDGEAARVVRAPRAAKRESAPIPTAGRDRPLAIVPARELLATADDRDAVFVTLLRAARSRARWAGLLTVQGGAAIGRAALAEPNIDTVAVATVLVPLDSPSPFRTVVANGRPYVGSLVSGDPSIDSMILRMGGSMPPSALILPITLRDRVVALVVAHRVHSELKLSDVTELLPLASAAADALGRLIVKHKAAGYRAPAEAAVAAAAPPPVVELAEQIDTKKIVRPDGEWRTPAPVEQPAVPGFQHGRELSISAEPPRPIDHVLDAIERASEGGADDAITDAVERAQDTLGALMRRFPGKLRVDRFAVTGRALRAAQYGGLLELVVRLGSAASELLIEKMSAPQRDARFYATVCVAELRPRNAVYALVERLFDQDYGVRASAIEALSGYPVDDLGSALVRARRAVHSSDPEVVVAATAAIVALGDVEAIQDLIGAIERGDRGSDAIRKALVVLTAQDFGTSERKWRKWWEASRRRHRIEWLIDGLVHKDDAIRESAINDLRRLTGEYFGYHHDLPRRERDAAAQRWATWWREAGHRRFATADDERGRPTGVVPVPRRD